MKDSNLGMFLWFQSSIVGLFNQIEFIHEIFHVYELCIQKNNENWFNSRLAIREDWRGLRDQDLEEKSGIEGTIFVHASGFIGGCKTKEGAMKMALLTIEASK